MTVTKAGVRLLPMDNNKQHHKSGFSEKEIDLKEIFTILYKRLWIIVLTTVLFTILGGYYQSRPTTPLYQATTRFILQEKAQSDSMSTLQVLIKEPIVLKDVLEKLGLKRSINGLRSQLSVNSVNTSQVVILTVTDADPEMAALIANTTVEVYKEVISKVLNFNNVIILTEAKAEEHPIPINPKSNQMIYLGFIGGLVLGIGAAFLLNSLNDKLTSEREMEQLLGLPVLGNVSRMRKKDVLVRKAKEIAARPIRSETIGS